MEKDFFDILSFVDVKNFGGTRWLITGGTGIIGGYLTAFLGWLNEMEDSNKIEITVIHRRDSIKDHPIIGWMDDKEYVSFLKVDLDEEFCIPNLSDYDYVVHAASNAAPKAYLSDPIGTIYSNVKGTDYFLSHLVHSNRLKCFLYISSGEIYGEPDVVPTPEDYVGRSNHLHPRGCYVESKKFAEVLCLTYFRHCSIPVKVVRPIHVFGPGFKKDDGRVWADFISNAIEGRGIEILSDGTAKRGFCYIATAISQIFSVIFKGNDGECYNIGSDQLVSIKELADIVSEEAKEVLNNNVEITIKGSPPSHLVGSPSVSCPNIEKVCALAPSVNVELREGVRRVLKWMIKNEGRKV